MMELSPNDIVFCPQEISFLHGLAWGFITPLYFGSTIVLAKPCAVEKVFETIEKYKVTVFVSVTTMFRMLLNLKGIERDYDLSSLRLCIAGGDPIMPKEYEEWRRRFKVDLLETMAQTEIGIYCGHTPKTMVKPSSCGKPLPGHLVKILDDNGKALEQGKIGHLVIDASDPGLFKEYLGMPQMTESSRKEGWYYTGDMAYLDHDGYVWFVGRSDDMFKSRGYLISPQEIERIIMEYPAVKEACVVPVPDQMLGNIVKAFVSIREESKRVSSLQLRQNLKEFLADKIAPYKVPKLVEIISEVPKTQTGKIKRKALRTS